MPIPTWAELIALVQSLGVCGVPLILLIIHMYREERHVLPKVEKVLDEIKKKEI